MNLSLILHRLHSVKNYSPVKHTWWSVVVRWWSDGGPKFVCKILASGGGPIKISVKNTKK